MGHIETSYAAALLACAENPAQAMQFSEALDGFSKAMETSDELRVFLLNPVLPREAQKNVLKSLALPDADEKLLNFLYLLMDKGRIAQLPEISREYRRQHNKMRGCLVITVRSAAPLPDSEYAKIRSHFAENFGAQDACVEPITDPHLIGGVRVQVGDMLYDNSLWGRLEGLRRTIGEQL